MTLNRQRGRRNVESLVAVHHVLRTHHADGLPNFTSDLKSLRVPRAVPQGLGAPLAAAGPTLPGGSVAAFHWWHPPRPPLQARRMSVGCIYARGRALHDCRTRTPRRRASLRIPARLRHWQSSLVAHWQLVHDQRAAVPADRALTGRLCAQGHRHGAGNGG
jgi:hypothetical protein